MSGAFLECNANSRQLRGPNGESVQFGPWKNQLQ